MTEERKEKDKATGLISRSENIAIIPSKAAAMDSFGAGVALYYMIKELGKDVSLIYPGKLPEKGQDFIKPGEIKQDLGKRSLLVSIDYSDTEASKVNYSTEDDVLYLTINPIPKDFEKDKKIKSEIIGFNFDLVFTLGLKRPTDLGTSFEDLDFKSDALKVINIDNSKENEKYGFVNIVDSQINSVSQILMDMVPNWNLKINKKAAKALLEGIISSEAS